jgi:outer membrane protein
MRFNEYTQTRAHGINTILVLLVISGCSAPVYEPPAIDGYIQRLKPACTKVVPNATQIATGQDVVQDKPLTLEACVRIAFDKNPLQRAAGEGVKAARAAVGVAKSAYYPEIDAIAGYSRWQRHIFLPSGISLPGMTSSVGPTDDWVANLNLRYALFDSGERRAELIAATAQEHASKERTQEVQLDIALNVHRAYYGLLAAQEALEIAEKNLARAANHLKIATEKRAAGIIPEAEVVRVKVEVANNRLALVRARGLIRITEGTLNAAMGLPVEIPIELEIESRPVPELDRVILTEKLNEAMHLRPELKAALHRVAMAQSKITSAKSSFGPKVYAESRYGREDTSFFPEDKSWMAGLYVQVPIFDGRLRSSKVSQAEAELAQEQEYVRHLLLKVQEEVWTAHARLTEACEAVTATEAVVKDARESMRLITERYKEGFATTNDLLDSQADLVLAEGLAARAHWDSRIAQAVFRRVVGNLLANMGSE